MHSLVAPHFGLDRSLDRAQDAFKRHLVPVLVGGLTYLGLALASVLTVVGALFLLPALTAGLLHFVLGVVDDRPRLEDLFLGFRSYTRTTLGFGALGALFALLAAPAGLSAWAAMGGEPLWVLPGVLLTLVGALLGPPILVWAAFFAVDRQVSWFDALRAAAQVTRAQPWRTLGAYALPLALWLAIPPLAPLAWPLVLVFWAVNYRQIMPRR